MLTDEKRAELVRANLDAMFKNLGDVRFIERKEYNNPGLDRAVYWVFGFEIPSLTRGALHSAILDLTGYIDIRLHSLRAKQPAEMREIIIEINGSSLVGVYEIIK
jgi:hypothetical protein